MPVFRVGTIVAQRFFLACGVALLITIWVASLVPSIPEVGVGGEDKFEHAFAYGSTMLWWALLFPRFAHRAVLAVLLVAMGIYIEYVQLWTGWRTYEVEDMVADGAGVALGWGLAHTPVGTWIDRVKNLIVG